MNDDHHLVKAATRLHFVLDSRRRLVSLSLQQPHRTFHCRFVAMPDVTTSQVNSQQ